jgi:hypothetical protein
MWRRWWRRSATARGERADPAGAAHRHRRGSRGIGRLPEIVARWCARCGRWTPIRSSSRHGQPWRAAEGQREVLAHLGVTDAQVGAPIVSDMATAEIGRTDDGIPVGWTGTR